MIPYYTEREEQKIVSKKISSEMDLKDHLKDNSWKPLDDAWKNGLLALTAHWSRLCELLQVIVLSI